MRRMSSFGTSIPSTPLTRFTLTFISFGSKELPVDTSTCVELTLPHPSSSIKCSARFIAITVVYSYTPFAYMALESEDCPNARELFLILSLANFAASNMTSLVVSRISEFRPPIIPARATGFLPSQMTRFEESRENSFSSSVVIFSPSLARRTRMASPSRYA